MLHWCLQCRRVVGASPFGKIELGINLTTGTSGPESFAKTTKLSIVAFRLVVRLPVVGLVSSYDFSRTGLIYAGSFVYGVFVTWLLEGGQAWHSAFR